MPNGEITETTITREKDALIKRYESTLYNFLGDERYLELDDEVRKEKLSMFFDKYTIPILKEQGVKDSEHYRDQFINKYFQPKKKEDLPEVSPIGVKPTIEKPEELPVEPEIEDRGILIQKMTEEEPVRESVATSVPEEKPSVGRAIYESLARGSASLGRGISRIPAFIYTLAAMPQNVVGEVLNIQKLKVEPPEWLMNHPVAKYYDKQVEAWNAADERYDNLITGYLKNGEIGNALGLLAANTAETLPLMIGLYMAGFGGATPVQTLTGMGLYAGAEKMKELEDVDLPEYMKTFNALTTGLAEGAFETVGTVQMAKLGREIFEKAGVEEGKKILKKGFKTTFKRAFKKMYGTAAPVAEGLEEAATTFTQNLTDRYSGVDPERNPMDGIGDSFLIGMTAAGAMTAPIRVATKVKEVRAKKSTTKIKVEPEPVVMPELAYYELAGKEITKEEAKTTIEKAEKIEDLEGFKMKNDPELDKLLTEKFKLTEPEKAEVPEKKPEPFTEKELIQFETTGRIRKTITGAEEVLRSIEEAKEGIKEGKEVEIGALTTQGTEDILGEVPGKIKTEKELEKYEAIANKIRDEAQIEIGRRSKEGTLEEPEGNFILGNKSYETKEELFKDLEKFEDLTALPETMHLPTIKAIEEYEKAKVKSEAPEGKVAPPEIRKPRIPEEKIEAPEKEPWEMTRNEFAEIGLRNNYWQKDDKWFTTVEGKEVEVSAKEIRRLKDEVFAGDHKHRVEKALSEGKAIPEEVLKDYPELTKEKIPGRRYNIRLSKETSDEAAKKVESEKEKKDFIRDYIDYILEPMPERAYLGREELGLSKKEILAAIKNVREGKETKQARTLIDKLEKFYDEGYVELIRGRGIEVVKEAIPVDKIKELIEEAKTEINDKDKLILEEITESLKDKIEKEGITLENIDQLKEQKIKIMKDVFDFEKADIKETENDYELIKEYLNYVKKEGKPEKRKGAEPIPEAKLPFEEGKRVEEKPGEVEKIEPEPRVKVDLAFNAENLTKPKKEAFETATDKIVKRSEIAKEISEKLNVPIRRGKFRKKALGIYKEEPKIIRIKAGDIRTISHEVGHYLDDIIPNTFSIKIKNTEIESLLREYGEEVKLPVRQKEAFAEYLRFYLTEPIKVSKVAPEFHRYFKKAIGEYPEINDVLLSARRDYQRWIEMPATSKVLSQISMEEEKKGIKEKVIGAIEDIYKTTLDDLYPIKQFVSLAKKAGIEIPEEENPYILARVIKGWVSKANVFLEKGTFNKKFWEMIEGRAVVKFKGKSFKSILRPIERKNGMDDFVAYLASKHAIEVNKYGMKTGIETKDAESAIEELMPKYPEFPKTAKELYEFKDDVLEYGRQSGLYDKELLAKFKSKYKYHVNFYRVYEELRKQGYMGKGFANVSKVIKRMKGSEREIINPLESIVKDTYMIINAADRNQVGVMTANLAAKNMELARLFEEIPTPMAKVAQVKMKDLGIDLTNMTEAEMDRIIDIFRPSMFLPKENILPVLKDGKKKYFQVDPDLYKALMATEREEMGILIKLLSTPTKWLRAGAILTPEFMIRNPARDIMTAFVYSKYGFIPIIDNIKGIFSLVKKDSDYWLWRMGGGEHSMLVSMDRKYLKKSFDEIIKGKKFTDYIKNPLEALRIVAEISEKINRLPEAKRALTKGKSPIEAAYASREITLDFAKGGATGRVLNRIIAFWKAWALGWEKMVLEFKNRPTKTTAKVLMGITLPSIILYLINRDDPRWKEIPQWQKDLFWIIMTEKHIYRIPKPFELGIIFGSVPERILEYIFEKDPKVIKKLAQNVLSSQSPGIVPTALESPIENWTNYDFFLERPVVPRGKEALPPEAQYTGYTSEAAKKLGEILRYSPAKIDNIIQGYFAGLGRHVTDGIDEILKWTGVSPSIPEPSPTLADIPIIKAFIVRRPIGSSSESVDRFYEKYKEYEAGEKMLKYYISHNEKEKFYKYKSEHPEILLNYDWKTKKFYSSIARYFRKTAKQMSELRKKENLIYESTKMTREEKRIKIDEIDELITEYAEETLKFVEEIMRTGKFIEEEKKKFKY